MNDFKAKRKFSFNLIDVILILVIIVSATVLISDITGKDIVTSRDIKTVKTVYKLEVSQLDEELRGFVEVGDKVYCPESDSEIGEITNVLSEPCYYTGINQTTGKPVSTVYPRRVTMIITVTADAEYSNGKFIVNGKELVIGEDIEFRLHDFTGIGKCTDISDGDSAN